MKMTAILAVSLLCLTGGAALAAGDGDGPYGTPDTAASVPAGMMRGELQYRDMRSTSRAAGEIDPNPASNLYSEKDKLSPPDAATLPMPSP